MFKTALNKNIIPHTWKLANIVPIPKPHKDTDNGTSYRPISLLSVIAKTLEKSSKRHSLQAVELSQRTQAAVQIVSNLPDPSNGGPIYRFWACRPCGPAGWMALLLTKADDVETNPGPTTLNQKVWICDICHKQIHVRKQISIRCYRIEHWVHLRCAGIRQAQYTDT